MLKLPRQYTYPVSCIIAMIYLSTVAGFISGMALPSFWTLEISDPFSNYSKVFGVEVLR